jgi:ubiquinone/menaquinone biosynthesis C-methylase UbiE
MQPAETKKLPTLKMLPRGEYAAVNREDPLRFYYWPFLGRLYRRRIEICLAQCTGGKRVLEIGFGSGLTFFNLNESYEKIYGLDLTAPVGEVAEMFKLRGIETKLINGSVLQMPYENDYFDTVLLISILEHLKPDELRQAFSEIKRVLRKGGQVVYGVPVERPFMRFAFLTLGVNIRTHHFSTEKEVHLAAEKVFEKVRIESLKTTMGTVYQIGHFIKKP